MEKLQIVLGDIDVVTYDNLTGKFSIQMKEELDNDMYSVGYSEGLHVIFALDRIRDASREAINITVLEDDEDETVEEVDEDSGCKSCKCR